MSYHQAAHHRAKCYHSLVGVGLGEAQKEILPDHFLKLLGEIDLLSIPASNFDVSEKTIEIWGPSFEDCPEKYQKRLAKIDALKTAEMVLR